MVLCNEKADHKFGQFSLSLYSFIPSLSPSLCFFLLLFLIYSLHLALWLRTHTAILDMSSLSLCSVLNGNEVGRSELSWGQWQGCAVHISHMER